MTPSDGPRVKKGLGRSVQKPHDVLMTSETQANRTYARHSEGSAIVVASPEEVFDFLDEHRNLASHMGSGNSPMMGGGQMVVELDAADGKELGSHIVMRGSAFGFDIYVDEVVIERERAVKKTWETVEERLVVIGAYRLGFTLAPAGRGTNVTVWIDYDLPARRRWLGRLGGRMYARWCVKQMLGAAIGKFPDQ